MNLRNQQRPAVEDAIDHDPDHLLPQSEQVLLEVLDALENASVDTLERKIVWADASRLSVEETSALAGIAPPLLVRIDPPLS